MTEVTRGNHVLVTGIGGPSGRAAVTALKQRGFRTLGVDMNPVAHDADAFVQVPAATAADYPAVLAQLIETHGIDWVFPTVAEELVVIAEHAPTWRARGVTVFISASPEVRVCHDKWETARVLKSRGISVPASAVGTPDDVAVRALGFPVVSRPRVGRGGRGVVVHDGPGVSPSTAGAIWQEFMPGTEYDVLFVRHPDAPHRTVMQQVFEKVELREGRVGNAVAVKPADAPDVAGLADAAAAVLGLTGPLDMDIRRGRDGRPRLLEINARIGAHALKAPQVFDVLVELVRAGHRG